MSHRMHLGIWLGRIREIGGCLFLALNLNQRYWPLQSISYSCELQAFYYYCCGYTSIVCLMAISINRLVGICMPTYYDRGKVNRLSLSDIHTQV